MPKVEEKPEIQLDPEETKTWYVRFRTGNTSLPISVLSPLSQRDQTQVRIYLVSAIVVGILTFIVLATFPLAFVGRRVVLLYAGAQISSFAFCAHMDGLTTAYLWPDDPGAWRNFGSEVAIFYDFLLIHFARLFFDTKRRNRYLDNALRVATYFGILFFVAVAASALAPQLPRVVVVIPSVVIGAFAWIGLPVLAIYGTLRWSRNF